ncbi:daunorubicin resistance protein DrrA family ABC transporter ATP-binding protein [Actinocorallia lasiicapitis]
MIPAIEAAALRRSYKQRKKEPKTALDGLSLSVAQGEIHGLLGPNGAGKTTLVKILATILLPSDGTAAVHGRDVVTETAAVRELIGVVLGGDLGLYGRLSARRNLRFFGTLYRLDAATVDRRADELLERVGLADRADDRVEWYSRGMKQRLHLARGLLHRPEVLFLDEPTAGLDPVAAAEFRTLIRELRAEGRTVLLATHDLDEAAALCDRISLIDQGRLLFSGPPSEAGRFLGSRECVEFTHPDPAHAEAVAALDGVLSVDPGASGTWRAHAGDEAATARILRLLLDRGVLTGRRAEPSLEEVYLRVMGERGLKV